MGNETRCDCDSCCTKRSKFKDVVSILSERQGTALEKIRRNIEELPDNFIQDMRRLLTRIRRNGNANLLSKNQLDFFKKYKRILRNIVKPHARDLLSYKRRYMDKNIPFAEAFGKTYIENPQAFDVILDSMNFH